MWGGQGFFVCEFGFHKTTWDRQMSLHVLESMLHGLETQLHVLENELLAPERPLTF